MKGANKGPEKTVMEKSVTAKPRVRFPNMSEKTAATTASGQEPKTPPKKRVMRTVCKSLPTAVAMLKTENPNIDKILQNARVLAYISIHFLRSRSN